MEITRAAAQRTTPYKAFITQESYEKYSLVPSFTEYLEQAVYLQLQDQRYTAQHTAKGPDNKGALSRGHNVDSSPAPVSHGAMPRTADSEIQFPRISRISSEDQELFLEEYRSILEGDMNKLELNKMHTVQELKSLILAEQEEFQQFAYQQARAHYGMYNIVPPDVKMAFQEDMCNANKACLQDHPQYYSLHQTLGLSVGAVYKTDPIMQHEHTVLQLGNVPILCLPDNVGRGMKLLAPASGVADLRASSGITVTKRKPLSQDTTAFNLAKQLNADMVIASEALKTLIDNQGPDYTEQWELPVCVEQLIDIEETAAGKQRKVICIDDPLPKKCPTPYRVNYDFYRRSLRRLLCQKQEGCHHSLPARQRNEVIVIPSCNEGNKSNPVELAQASVSSSSLERDSLDLDKKEESSCGEGSLTEVETLQANGSSLSNQPSSKRLKLSYSVSERHGMEIPTERTDSVGNFHTEVCNTEELVENFISRRKSDIHTSEQNERQYSSIAKHDSEAKKRKLQEVHPAPTLHQEDTTETTSTLESQDKEEQRHLAPQNTEDATTQGREEHPALHQEDTVETTSTVASQETGEQRHLATTHERETTPAVCFQDSKEQTSPTAHTQSEGATTPAVCFQDSKEQTSPTAHTQSEGATTPAVCLQYTMEQTSPTAHTQSEGKQPALPTHVKDFRIIHEAATAQSQDTARATPSPQFNKRDQHVVVRDESRSKEHSASKLHSQADRKRSAASAKHFQDEENDVSSSKLPRYEEQAKHEATQGQVTAEVTDSVVYTLWRFGKLKLLVQSSLDAYREDSTKPNKYAFYSVMPKLEYQPRLGHARLTPSETSRFWLQSYLRPNTRLLCGRVNVHNSELMKIDELEISDVLSSGLVFNPARGMKMVWQVLNCLSKLSEGKYLLSHAPRDIHCCMYRSVICETEGARRSMYDLHQAHSAVGKVAPFMETEIPWAAMDTNRFLLKHIEENRIPCTFPAVSAKRLQAELQSVEKQKGQKAQHISNPTKKAKKGKKKNKPRQKTRDDRSQGVSSNPATNPSAGNALRQSKAHQQKNGLPGVRLLAHSSLDDVISSCVHEGSVSKSRRSMAPITYDDVNF